MPLQGNYHIAPSDVIMMAPMTMKAATMLKQEQTMRMATALASALASTSMVMTAMRRVLRVLLLNHHTVTVSV